MLKISTISVTLLFFLILYESPVFSATADEVKAAFEAGADYIASRIYDPEESGYETWGVLPGFYMVPGGGPVGNIELSGYYASAGLMELYAYQLLKKTKYLYKSVTVLNYLLNNQYRASEYLVKNGFTPGGIMVVEGGNPTFYTTHNGRALNFIVEMYKTIKNPDYLDAAIKIMEFELAEVKVTNPQSPNYLGYIYTVDISHLPLFCVGYSEGQLFEGMLNLEGTDLMPEITSELISLGLQVTSVMQDTTGGIFYSNLNKLPSNLDVWGSNNYWALKPAGYYWEAEAILDWLVSVQDPQSGAFDCPYHTRNDYTREHAAALQSLIDAGYSPYNTQDYAGKAMDWLLDKQLSSGAFPKYGSIPSADDDATSLCSLSLYKSLSTTVYVVPDSVPVFSRGSREKVGFNATVVNNKPGYSNFTAWADITKPDFSKTSIVLGPYDVELPPLKSQTRHFTVDVTFLTEPGNYIMNLYIASPNSFGIDDRDGFGFKIQ